MRINGEIDGLKKSILEELDSLYDFRIPQDLLWTKELVDIICRLSSTINREISIYIDRKGRITDVSVGDNQTVTLAAVEGKRSSNRLTGTRCIHTHPNGSGFLSDVDISSLKMLRLDAMIAVGIKNGAPRDIYIGIVDEDNTGGLTIMGPYYADKEEFKLLFEYISEADQRLRQEFSKDSTTEERAILVGLHKRDSRELNGANEADVSFAELEELAKTAGALVVGRLMQKRNTRSSSTVIGHGKIDELRLLAQAKKADLVIFDEELTGTQQRNIEQMVGLKVLCRTGLILDIFAQRARSREGILQVELAQLEYQLPRLMGMGLTLSRLGGGIGTRGPGETKLETDRRRIRMRIAHLKKQLDDIRRQRGVLRGNRQKTGIPVVSIVGYTNAGKSTLLNTLCDSEVLAEDKLFATLDTTTRKLVLSNGTTVLITDTVGFIRKLPHKLLDAFKSTLEEVVLSDLILIVADASDAQVEDHIRIVDEILAELGAGTKSTIIALNKIDISKEDNPVILRESRPIFEISAKNGFGLDLLKQAIEKIIHSDRVQIQLTIPISDGATMAWLHTNSKILNVSYDEDTSLVEVELDKSLLTRVTQYMKESAAEVDADM